MRMGQNPLLFSASREFFLPLLRFDEEVVAVPVAAGQRAGQAAPLPRFLSPPHRTRRLQACNLNQETKKETSQPKGGMGIRRAANK